MATSRKSTTPAPTTEQESIPTTVAEDFAAMRQGAVDAMATAEGAADYAKSALAEYVAAEEAGERAAVRASFAAYAALRAGILVEGRKPDDAAEGVMSAKEYAAAWVTPKHPEGVSPASVTTWLRAGEAFVAYGLDPESRPAYALLSGLAQSSAWNATRAVLAKEEDGVTEEAIVAAVDAAAEKEAARKAAAKTKAAERKEREQESGIPDALDKRVALVETVLAALDPSKPEDVAALQNIAERVAAALAGAESDAA
jgi:hypothetical protein